MTAQTAPRSRALRRATVAVAVAGAAALGTLVSAPQTSAASAAGPDWFIPLEHGTAPVFFCDPEKPHKQHNTCLDLSDPRVG